MTWGELVAEPWFWPAVTGLEALAALMGSGATWAVSAFLRWHTRPEPDWLIEASAVGYPAGGDRYGRREGYEIKGTLTNVGDGIAHSVRISPVKSCNAGLQRTRPQQLAPLMDRGSSEEFFILIPLDSWDQAEVALEWIDPPTRLKRGQRIPLDFRSVVDQPQLAKNF